MRIELRHQFPGPPERAWEELFSDPYENAVSADQKLERKVLLDEDPGGKRHRRIHVIPDKRLPGAVAKVIGTEKLSYVLDERHDPDRNRMDFVVTPDGMHERVEVKGSWEVRPSAGGCERVVVIDITVRIPVVGSRIEKQIGEDLKESYEAAAIFARRWLQEHA